MAKDETKELQDSPNSAVNPGESSPDSTTRADQKDEEKPSAEEGRFRVLSNGAVFDTSVSRIVKGQALTSAQGKDLAAKRQLKTAKAVRQAIAEGDETAHGSALRNVYGGVKTIATAQMLLATTPDAGRASTEAAKWLLRTGQLVAEDSSSVPVAGARLELGRDAAIAAVAMLAAERERRGG